VSLKPPPPETGDKGLKEFREAVKLQEEVFKAKWERNFHRKDLARWEKLYRSLSKNRLPESPAAKHFEKLSRLCHNLLLEFGPEPPPKKRRKKAFVPVALTYPKFPDAHEHRLHFLDGPSLKRRRAVQLASYAASVSHQESDKGRTLISVDMPPEDIRLYERLVDVINDVGMDLEKAGFETGYAMRPEGIPVEETYKPNPLDPELPLAKIRSDNWFAQGYTRWARVQGNNYRGALGKGLPKDLPSLESTIAWDPDPRYRRILELTESNQLQNAMELVEAIPGEDREPLVDEVIYLRFLTETVPKAADIRLLARKFVRNSTISDLLMEEFPDYLELLNQELVACPPLLKNLTVLRPEFGKLLIPPRPPAADWPKIRERFLSFTFSSIPRGRIFSVNIGIGLGDLQGAFFQYMYDAEHAFRQERSMPFPETPWVSEAALLDLVRTIWPSAIHQWRPPFLGLQSVDIYVPEIELAIEYQGQQHYEPIEFFGGEEGFRMTQARDNRKRALLKANNVQLLEWPYHIPLSKTELIQSIEEIGISMTEN